MKKIIISFLFQFSFIFSVWAQSPELGELYTQKQTYFQNKDYENARIWGEKMLAQAEKEFGKQGLYANYAGDMAGLYLTMQLYAQAEPLLIETLKLYEKSYGKNSQFYAITLYNLGTVYQGLKKYELSEKTYLETLTIYEKVFGKEHQYYEMANQSLAKLYEENEKWQKLLPFYLNDLTKEDKKSANYPARLNNTARLYEKMQDYSNAEKYYLQSLEIYEKIVGKDDEYFNISNNLALLYLEQSNYLAAEPLFKEILTYLEKQKGKNSTPYAVQLTSLADLYRKMGEYSKAEIAFKESLLIEEKNGGKATQNYATGLNNLAHLYRVSGKFTQAEPLFLQAIEIEEKKLKKMDEGYAILLKNTAMLYFYLGNFNKFQFYTDKSLAIYERLFGKNHPKYAETIRETADIYAAKGEYGHAEKFYQTAIAVYAQTYGKNNPTYAKTLGDLASLYTEIWQPEKAIGLYKESIDILAQTLGNQHPDYANLMNNFAVFWLNIGELKECESLFKQVLAIREKTLGKSHLTYLQTINNLADVYLRQERFKDAQPLYEELNTLSLNKFGKDHPMHATYLNNIAIFYQLTNNCPKAEPLLLQSFQIRQKLLGKKNLLYSQSLFNLGKLYECLNKWDLADNYYQQLNEICFFQIREFFPAMSEFEKQRFYSSIQLYIENFKTFSLNRAKTRPQVLGELFDNQLITKAMLINASNKIRRTILNSQDQNLKKMFQDWQTQKDYLAKVYELSLTEIQQNKINIPELEAKANDLEKQISLKSTAFAQSNDKKAYTWQDIQKQLKPDEALIEIIQAFNAHTQDTSSTFYICLIINKLTKNNPEFVILENGTQLENRHFKYYLNSIKFQKEDKNSYRNYWQALSEKLKGIKKVYISPDGVYNQINLNTLRNPETKKFVLDEIDIQLLSNSKDLLSAKNNISKSKKVALFGFPDYNDYPQNKPNSPQNSEENLISVNADSLSRFMSAANIVDLPGTKTEIESIEAILLANAYEPKAFLQNQATEDQLKSLDNPAILHIATHGYFLQDNKKSNESGETRGTEENTNKKAVENPLLRAGLLLAGAKKAMNKQYDYQSGREDGILTAYEAMNLRLDATEMVVLSACETGLGEVVSGEGVYGLQRSFQVAGAKNLLMSLWTVNDEATQILMKSFYEEWMKTKNKRLAFQNAQMQLREKYPHPYFWGAFVMLGE